MKKSLTAAVFVVLLSFAAAAKQAAYSGDDYSIILNYTDTVSQGDAAFLRLQIMTSTQKPKKAIKSGSTDFSAAAQVCFDDQTIDTVAFYPFNPKNRNVSGADLLSGIAFPQWYKTGEYTVIIAFKTPAGDKKKFSVPLKVEHKDFIEENIQLDDADVPGFNTQTQDFLEQTDKLNIVLSQTDNSAVFQTSVFAVPLTGAAVSSPFGARRTYEFPNGKKEGLLHAGIDYTAADNMQITSCGDGKVVYSGKDIPGGKIVIIEHLPGLFSVYKNLKSASVKDGQTVRTGDKIGLAGAAGTYAEQGFHWEIRLNGAPVNPESFTKDFSFSGTGTN